MQRPLCTDVATFMTRQTKTRRETRRSTFSLEGADKALFKLRDTTAAEEQASSTPTDATRQVLEFKDKPDYEKPMDAQQGQCVPGNN